MQVFFSSFESPNILRYKWTCELICIYHIVFRMIPIHYISTLKCLRKHGCQKEYVSKTKQIISLVIRWKLGNTTENVSELPKKKINNNLFEHDARHSFAGYEIILPNSATIDLIITKLRLHERHRSAPFTIRFTCCYF